MRYVYSAMAVVGIAALCVMSGCGGGGGGATGAVEFAVHWPAAPAGAQPALIPAVTQSIIIGLTQGATQVAPPQTVVRGADPMVTVSFSGLAPGTILATATAYPNADGTGTPVASGTVSVQVVAGQTARQALTMGSTIATVEITPSPASVQVGDDLPLVATAKDGSGQTVLVPATGAFAWSVTAGGSYASADTTSGVVTGVAAGDATVQVTENESGMTASLSVTITPPPAPPLRYIAFDSGLGVNSNVYLYDRQTSSFVNLPGLNGGGAYTPSLSSDGRYVAYGSHRGGAPWDIYLYDRQTSSEVSPPGVNTARYEFGPSMTADTRYIAFFSDGHGGMGDYDVFLYDRSTSSFVALPGINSSGIDSYPSITDDGRYIAFQSNRSGGLGNYDIYLFDRQSNSLVDLPGLNGPTDDSGPSISADGRYIVFQSSRTGGAGLDDIYLYDRQAGSLVDLPGPNSPSRDLSPAISADGRYIAFSSDRPGGMGGSDIYLYDRQTSSLVDLPGLNSAAGADNVSIR